MPTAMQCLRIAHLLNQIAAALFLVLLGGNIDAQIMAQKPLQGRLVLHFSWNLITKAVAPYWHRHNGLNALRIGANG